MKKKEKEKVKCILTHFRKLYRSISLIRGVTGKVVVEGRWNVWSCC